MLSVYVRLKRDLKCPRFEKYISGKYLGEIVRIVLVKLTKEGLLFLDKDLGRSFFTPGTLTSDLVSYIEQ